MSKAFSIFGSSSRPQLGPFEQKLLQEIWSLGSATVRELVADGKIHQAYTTVLTTVHRLYKKGLLDRADTWPNLEIAIRGTSADTHTLTPLWLQRQVHELVDHALERELARLPTAAAP